MKTILKTTLAVFAFIAFHSANAQDQQAKPAQVTPAAKETPIPAAATKHNDMSSWAELKAFHVVMSQTFHPSEEGNLKPIRERSGELNEKAIALEKSKIPADFNKPEIVAATKDLSAKTKALNDLIKAKGSDEKVQTLLSATHDSFHKIVGLCSGGEERDERKQ